MIAIELLTEYGGLIKEYQKSDVIFEEGNQPKYYYQILSGEVKMCNYNDFGREFIQGIFHKNQCFGEPPLLIDKAYPANAIASEDTRLLCVPKDRFIELLSTYPLVSLTFIKNLSQRLYYKSVMSSEISSQEPVHRILRLIDFSIEQFKFNKDQNGYLINLTRQQIGDLTGLRVETVIRAIKLLEKKGELKIINRKVYR